MRDFLQQRLELSDRPGARVICEQMIAARLEDVYPYRILISLAMDDKRPDEALFQVERALRELGERAELVVLRGTLRRARGEEDAAIADFKHSLELEPSAEVHNDLGNMMRRRGLKEEAETHYRAAIALNPKLSDALNGMGILRKEARDLEGAVAYYKAAVDADPNNPFAHNNLAIARQDEGRLDASLALFDRAVEVRPDYVPARFHRALLLLLLGLWKEGFAEYQWRWRMPNIRSPHISGSWWDGSPLDGRTILFHGEQGMGDVLQFVRYAALLREAGGRVVVEAPRNLLRLLSTVPGVDQLVAKGDPAPAFDVQMPMMSLPLVMGWEPHTLPPFAPYLTPEPGLVEKWKARLPPGKRIGLTWQGNPDYRADHHRSPALTAFLPVLRTPGVSFVSLQKGPGVEQLADLPPDVRVMDLSTEIDTGPDAFLDTAALMTCLDLLIVSDSAPLHLAGALGCPALVPLPHVPDWRFLTGPGEDCVWYPSLRLFRQDRPGAWQGVFERIAREIAP